MRSSRKRWERGDIVRVSSDVTPYGSVLDHAGEVGVIVYQSQRKGDKTWYNHVWFGPWTDELATLNEHRDWIASSNWRGYDDDMLDFVPTMWPYRMKEDV